MSDTEPAGTEAAAFAAQLRRRAEAARGLERDLLHEVPLLYGSPSTHAPYGDPGVILARIHRDEMLRRHGGGIPEPRAVLPSDEAASYLTMATKRGDAFTRLMRWLAFR